MSRLVPSGFLPLFVEHYAHQRPVRTGNDAAVHYGEMDLAANCNFLHTALRPPIVSTIFASGGMMTSGAAAPVLRALWRRRPFLDFTDWEVVVLAAMTGSTDSGRIRVEIASGAGLGAGGSSDSAAGVTITVPAASAQWVRLTGSFTYDATQALDTLELHAWIVGVTDTLQIHSIEIRPRAITTIAAGMTTAGFGPFDTTEFAADEPLPSAHRQWMVDNLEVLRKTRTDTIVAWSEDVARAAASQFSTTSATYQVVARIPFRSDHGQDSLEWTICGYEAVGGAGTVKLEVVGGASAEQALQATWASPYTAAQHSGTLACNENQDQELRVSIKGDGANAAYLMGLCAWTADV